MRRLPEHAQINGRGYVPITLYLHKHGGGAEFTDACSVVSKRVTGFLFSVHSYFLAERFMVYSYKKGSVSSRFSDIPVRLKLFYEFQKT